MIGLPKGEVFLVPWTKNWSKEFLLEEIRIENALGDLVIDIHHIGSTAIQGLSAKPIIDIAIEIASFNDGLDCIDPLEKLNYAYRGTDILPERYYFSKGEPRTFQIHMHQTGNHFLRQQLQFRDFLRHDESTRLEYQALKIKLSKANQYNKARYTAEKSDFIQQILKYAQLEGI